MYQVVETVEGNDTFVTAVPKSWVDDSVLLWPLRIRDMLSGRKNCITPENDWSRIKCRVIFDEIETWEEALQKEKTAEHLLSDESDFEESSQFNDSDMYLNTLMSAIISDEVLNAMENFPLPPESSNNINKENEDNLLAIDKRLHSLENNVMEIKHILNEFVAKTEVTLNLIVQNMCVGVEQRTEKIELAKEMLHLSSEESLAAMEERIGSDPSFKRYFIQKLSTFCGVSASKTIRTIAKLLFEDQLLKNYSWHGTNSKKKFEIYKNIFGAVTEAVREHYNSFSDVEAASFFKSYIKQAPFRIKTLDENKNNSTTTTTTTTAPAKGISAEKLN